MGKFPAVVHVSASNLPAGAVLPVRRGMTVKAAVAAIRSAGLKSFGPSGGLIATLVGGSELLVRGSLTADGSPVPRSQRIYVREHTLAHHKEIVVATYPWRERVAKASSSESVGGADGGPRTVEAALAEIKLGAPFHAVAQRLTARGLAGVVRALKKRLAAEKGAVSAGRPAPNKGQSMSDAQKLKISVSMRLANARKRGAEPPADLAGGTAAPATVSDVAARMARLRELRVAKRAARVAAGLPAFAPKARKVKGVRAPMSAEARARISAGRAAAFAAKRAAGLLPPKKPKVISLNPRTPEQVERIRQAQLLSWQRRKGLLPPADDPAAAEAAPSGAAAGLLAAVIAGPTPSPVPVEQETHAVAVDNWRAALAGARHDAEVLDAHRAAKGFNIVRADGMVLSAHNSVKCRCFLVGEVPFSGTLWGGVFAWRWLKADGRVSFVRRCDAEATAIVVEVLTGERCAVEVGGSHE